MKPQIEMYEVPNEPRKLCQIFAHFAGLTKNDFKLGASEIFLRPEKLDVFNQRLNLRDNEFKIFFLESKWRTLIYILKFYLKCE